MFDPNDYYISISRDAGEDLRALGIIRENAGVEDVRKVIIGGINSTVEVGEKELHYIVSGKFFGKDLGLWCVAKCGSPSGIQKYTLTIAGIISDFTLHSVFVDEYMNRNFLNKLYFSHAPHLKSKNENPTHVISNRDALVKEKQELADRITELKGRIYKCSIEEARGNYTNSASFHTDVLNLEKSKKRYQYIEKMLRGTKKSATIPQKFIDVCRTRLPKDTFESIMAEANLG